MKQPFLAVLVAAIFSFPLVALLFFHDRDEFRAQNATSNGELFLQDWEKMRTSTWVVEGNFIRTTSNGQVVSYPFHIAQRLPNYVRIVGSSGEAAIDGRAYACMVAAPATANLPATTNECKDAGAAPDFQSVMNADAARTRAAVLEDTAAYVVLARQIRETPTTASGTVLATVQVPQNCYTLVVRPERHAGSWGNKAEFCFDNASHAPLLQRFTQPTHVDELLANRVSDAPTDADVSATRGLGY